MRKLKISLLVAFFAGSLLQTSVFATNEAPEITNTVIEDQGVSLSIEAFNQTLVGKLENRKSVASQRSLQNLDLNLGEITLTDGSISFDANVGETAISLSGPLHTSYKVQNDMNSIVGDLTDATGNYKVLLFEIFNDTKKDNLLINHELNEKPHLKLYMLDSDNNILIFETDVPDTLSNLDASSFGTVDDNKKEMYWFKGLAKPESVTEIPTSDTSIAEVSGFTDTSVTPTALGEFSIWTNPTTYYTSFYVGSDYTQCYSLPYLSYKHGNVSSADTTWIAQFKIAEHTKVGSYTYYGNNVFEYKNIKIAFGSGDYSTIIKSSQQGRIYDTSILGGLKKTGDKIGAALYKKVLSAVPYGSTINDVLGYINTATSSPGDVYLGTQYQTLYGGTVSAVGQKLNSSYKLEECTDYNGQTDKGHYFTYHATVQKEGKGSKSTTGNLQLKFDVFNNETYTTTPISKDFSLSYNVL